MTMAYLFNLPRLIFFLLSIPLLSIVEFAASLGSIVFSIHGNGKLVRHFYFVQARKQTDGDFQSGEIECQSKRMSDINFNWQQFPIQSNQKRFQEADKSKKKEIKEKTDNVLISSIERITKRKTNSICYVCFLMT